MFGTALKRIGGILRPQLCCSFCGGRADEVDYLVAGASEHICDVCIAKCVAVLEQHGAPSAPGR